MKKKISFLIFFLVVFAVSGCALQQKLASLGFRSYKSIYLEHLQAHTQSKTLYRDFSTIAKATVTHFNKKLFEEYLKSLSKENLFVKKFRQYIDEFDKYDIYYLAFYTPDLNLNNLDKKNSFWIVYISECGNIQRPESIELIDKNDFRSSWLYSLKDERWSKQYIVKFKKNNCRKKEFVISSFLGSLVFKF
ncbi:hypothetical protein [Hippea jasoniae]|uniref:hypothetical protein n=1 Tax=Hippea jasoniae TaxID=944479 RepID=UPI00055731B5|nr:hypothetical protein [Hippea jasoniae]